MDNNNYRNEFGENNNSGAGFDNNSQNNYDSSNAQNYNQSYEQHNNFMGNDNQRMNNQEYNNQGYNNPNPNNFGNGGYTNNAGNGYGNNVYSNNTGNSFDNGGYNNNAGNGFANGNYVNNNNPDNRAGGNTNGADNNGFTNNSFGNPYNAPYQQHNNVKKSHNNKSNSFGLKLGKYAAIAAVFGLVAGAVFTGVNYVGSDLLGTKGSSPTLSSSNASNSVKNTSTGSANDLIDVSGIVDEVMPSIVAITNTGSVTYHSFFGEAQEYQSESCGTGVIVSKTDDSLYIATNNHVVADADELKVQFTDEKTVKAEIRGTDAKDDLAVVEVKIKDIEEDTLSKIKVATIGDSDKLSVGDASIAIGNALGYGQSVTTGVISALNSSVTTQDETTGETVTNSNLIQTDAAINPGNSGGALLNKEGEVIGINSVKYASTEVEGIGYAIPIAYAKPIIESLIKDGEYVNTQTAYLGIQGGDVTSDVASAYKIPIGVYVSSVIEGCGAQKAGIVQGDIIVKFDGKKISSMSELQSVLSSYKAGDKVKVVYARQNGNGYEESEVEVKLSSAKDMK